MSLASNESDKIRLKRLSRAAIGLRDLARQADFYANVLGLEVVEQSSQHLYFRAAGSHHHILELITPYSGLHHASFEVADDDELDRAVYILLKQGIPIILRPERELESGVSRLLR